MATVEQRDSEKLNAPVELERIFVPDETGMATIREMIATAPYYDITQIYERFVDSDGEPTGKTEYRYRCSVDRNGQKAYTRTIKQWTEKAGKKLEDEIEIPEEDYIDAFNRPYLGPVLKRRFIAGALSIDVYGPPFEGFVKVENECTTEEEMDAYIPPDGFIEVTDNASFSNRRMVKTGIPLGVQLFQTADLIEGLTATVPIASNRDIYLGKLWYDVKARNNGKIDDFSVHYETMKKKKKPVTEWGLLLPAGEPTTEQILNRVAMALNVASVKVKEAASYREGAGTTDVMGDYTLKIKQVGAAHTYTLQLAGRTIPLTADVAASWAATIHNWDERQELTLAHQPVNVRIQNGQVIVEQKL